MKRSLCAVLAALVLAAGLCACGGAQEPPSAVTAPTTPEASPAPTATPTPAPTIPPEPTGEPAAEPVADVAAGSYVYDDGASLWTLTLRDTGPYTLQREGDVPHTGESWTVNGDGTVSCSPTDLWTEPFADSYGCTSWVVYSDGRCEPLLPG